MRCDCTSVISKCYFLCANKIARLKPKTCCVYVTDGVISTHKWFVVDDIQTMELRLEFKLYAQYFYGRLMRVFLHQGPILLTWINVHSTMDK